MVTFWIQLFASSLVINSLTEHVAGTKGRLLLDGEPNITQVYDNYRLVFADKSYYHLAAANLLDESNIGNDLLEYTRDSSGNFDAVNFKFNGDEWFYRFATIAWFSELQERLALHVYDNPNDMELATGPQVNQKACGLLLDYMLHMIENYYQCSTNSTEYSVYRIMQTYGLPMPNIASGASIFPGDYRSCVEEKLNVMRKELVKVDEHEVEHFFKRENRRTLTLRQSVSMLINKYIGPLFGAIQVSDRDSINESVRRHVNELRLVPSRYCLAGLRYKHWKRSSFDVRNIVMRTGVCLPEYCDSKSLDLFHDKIRCLTEVQIPKYYHGYYIENLYCLPDENSKLRDPLNYTNPQLFIAFNVLWFVLTITATFWAKNKPIDTGRKNWKFSNGKKISKTGPVSNLLNCWNLRMNYRIVFGAKEDVNLATNVDIAFKKDGRNLKNRVLFRVIGGIKVLGLLSVINSHICMVSVAAAWNPIISNELVSKSFLALIIVFGSAAVNVFFVITGLTTAHLFFQAPKERLREFSFWFKFIAYRYLRIVPLFALTHWFLQTYFKFISSGPFWDYGTSNSAWQKVCENDSIWGVIFPIMNFKSPSATCNHVGWYLSNDIQSALITPFFILIFLKSAIFGYISTLLAIFAMIANYVRYNLQQPLESRGGFDISIMTLSPVTDGASADYVGPQYRLISYLVGICAGHLLHSYDIGNIKEWPKSFIKLVNTSSLLFICALTASPYISDYLPLQNKPLIHLMVSLLSGSVHGVASFVSAGFFILLCTNNYPTLSHILSQKLFRTLASASLSTLLIHIPLIYFHANTMKSLPELNLHNIIATSFIQIVETLILSMVIHILYEIPLRRFFVKLLFMVGPSKQGSIEARDDHHDELNKKTE